MLLGVSGVVAAPLALADAPKTTAVTVEKSNDIGKHIGFVDLYLTDAINSAKLLSVLAENAAGTPDKSIISEAQKNLDAAIDHSLTHVQKLHTIAAKQNLAQLDELGRQLRDAKTAAGKLSAIQLTDLGTAIDGVSTHLMGADTAFRTVAKQANYVRLGNTNLSAVPVRGEGEPGPNGIDRDLGKDKGSGAPTTPGEDMNVPKGSTHDTVTPTNPIPKTSGPGMTSPSSPGTAGATPQKPAPEPVQQAPGQGTPVTGQPGQ